MLQPPTLQLCSPCGRSARIALGLAAGLACTALFAQALTPPTGGSYVMRRQVIAAGGERSSGGPYVLTGTLAEAATDAGAVSANNFRLIGGFHAPTRPRADAVFMDGFENTVVFRASGIHPTMSVEN